MIQWQSTNQTVATIAPFQSQASDFFPIATSTATAKLVSVDGVTTIRAQVVGSSPIVFVTATLNVNSLAPVAKADQFATVQQCAGFFCLSTTASLTGNVMVDNGSGADDRGQPLATVVAFGGGDLGGGAGSYVPGQTISTPKGDVTVLPDGSLIYTRSGPTVDEFTVTFSYLLQNSSGVSGATVTIHVGPIGAGASVSASRTSATPLKKIDPRD
jgi:hypothetical protein